MRTFLGFRTELDGDDKAQSRADRPDQHRDGTVVLVIARSSQTDFSQDQETIDRVADAAAVSSPPRQRRISGDQTVAKSRRAVPAKLALTISRAAPTTRNPTSARIPDAAMITERMPNTIAASPVRISSPLAAAEPW